MAKSQARTVRMAKSKARTVRISKSKVQTVRMAKKQSSMQQQGCCLIPNCTMKGIHRTPSLPADGQLDYLVNLIPHDGELRPIPATEQLATRYLRAVAMAVAWVRI